MYAVQNVRDRAELESLPDETRREGGLWGVGGEGAQERRAVSWELGTRRMNGRTPFSTFVRALFCMLCVTMS